MEFTSPGTFFANLAAAPELCGRWVRLRGKFEKVCVPLWPDLSARSGYNMWNYWLHRVTAGCHRDLISMPICTCNVPRAPIIGYNTDVYGPPCPPHHSVIGSCESMTDFPDLTIPSSAPMHAQMRFEHIQHTPAHISQVCFP